MNRDDTATVRQCQGLYLNDWTVIGRPPTGVICLASNDLIFRRWGARAAACLSWSPSLAAGRRRHDGACAPLAGCEIRESHLRRGRFRCAVRCRRRGRSRPGACVFSSPASPDRLTSWPQRSCRPYWQPISLPVRSEPSVDRFAGADRHARNRNSARSWTPQGSSRPPKTASAPPLGPAAVQ